MFRRPPQKNGFTLIEMLIGVGIVAVISIVTVLAMNPTQVLRQGRDSRRITQLGLISTAVSVLHASNPATSLGSTTTVYISVPDSSATCANLGLTSLPVGWTYGCVPTSTLLNVNGTGWLPIDFASAPQGSFFDQLPTDPTNTVASGAYYRYIRNNNSWKLYTIMESTKYASEMTDDGGIDAALYEDGTNLGLQPQ